LQASLRKWRFPFTDFENYTTFKPHEHHDKMVHAMADEMVAWEQHCSNCGWRIEANEGSR
jgi:hypothetical protein